MATQKCFWSQVVDKVTFDCDFKNKLRIDLISVNKILLDNWDMVKLFMHKNFFTVLDINFMFIAHIPCFSYIIISNCTYFSNTYNKVINDDLVLSFLHFM